MTRNAEKHGVNGRIYAFSALAACLLVALLSIGASTGLAAALPDGRAYEQATPVNKNGASAQGAPQLVQAALNGGAIAFVSQSSFPGAEGAQDFGTYLATRGEAQWMTQGLLPPPSIGIEGRVIGKSADLKYSYVLSETDESVATFYQRDNSTKQLTPIAQVGIVEFVGTSADDSRVFFEAEKRLAPGAAEAPNLYVWNQGTGAITLAGSLNGPAGEAEAPPQGAVAGPYAWSTENAFAGGTTGSYYTTNAISQDGESIYFTSLGANQLYLRRNVGAPQSPLNGAGECTNASEACTVKVSTSQKIPLDPNGEKPAAFLAASSTGAPSVFFSSAGNLTNDANTGPEDKGKDLYKYEAATAKLRDLTSDLTDPNGAEVRGVLGASADGSRVYFVANGVLGNSALNGATRGDCTRRARSLFAEQGQCNLYVWEEGRGVTFIARLNCEGSESEINKVDSFDWVPTQVNGMANETNTARVSGNGAVLVFRSQTQFGQYENLGVPEFYRYQAENQELRCITCAPDGSPPVAEPTVFSNRIFAGFISQGNLRLSRNLAVGGGRFFFESADRLVSADVNGVAGCPLVRIPGGTNAGIPACQDVYEWEADGVGSCQSTAEDGGCLYLISTGTSPEPAFFADADAPGNNVFFYTSQRLVSQDKDDAVDIYDARVGGGLATQSPSQPILCQSQAACVGPQPSPPVEPSTGSLGVNPARKPPLQCRHGFKRIKRHGKAVCVRRHPQKSRQKTPKGKRSHEKSGGAK